MVIDYSKYTFPFNYEEVSIEEFETLSTEQIDGNFVYFDEVNNIFRLLLTDVNSDQEVLTFYSLEDIEDFSNNKFDINHPYYYMYEKNSKNRNRNILYSYRDYIKENHNALYEKFFK